MKNLLFISFIAVCSCNSTPPDIGDPCNFNYKPFGCANGLECLSNMKGGGWCTTRCQSDSDCADLNNASNINGEGNVCVQLAQAGNAYCFPTCSSNIECRVYGADLMCSNGLCQQ